MTGPHIHFVLALEAGADPLDSVGEIFYVIKLSAAVPPEAKSPLTNTTSTAEYAAHAAKISDRLAVVITASAPAKIIVNNAIRPSVSDGREADI